MNILKIFHLEKSRTKKRTKYFYKKYAHKISD